MPEKITVFSLFLGGIVMTISELSPTLPNVTCCICDRHLTAQGLNAFRSAVGGYVKGEVYCRTCMETYLVLCRECSACYTTDTGGICDECAEKMYAMTG